MSFLRRLSNPFMIWAPRRFHSEDIPQQLKDEIFQLQLGRDDFIRIDEYTFQRAGICGSHGFARKTLRALHKSGIVDESTGRPITTKIDRDIVTTSRFLSVPKQRELVMFLFFWEEEVTRWDLLCAEEAEIGSLLQGNEVREVFKVELQNALKVLRSRKQSWPSRRDQSGRALEAEEGRLPSYAEATS
ncbi:unnamed protein product [Zymoseptoria tritici ST99CH_1A5]|uniref:Uncharacterized protein n=2 Tax=Zymoseptoria tritici TaxID=1047171 RepID=F9X5L2_ZYMTI|nr:uncharacterized protein MYCGRDRAFT_91515 [Zymoseptoria tritici IPO323]EGP89511.1 hypothetical protein MYCGRDRAFT_91515 [Zymoseptoria tritici IPO323]SMY22282.1 unnamed protein product [Zymoseptoria tritici ST99CH_1A5]